MSTPTEIPEDRKQLIDALTSGYAFSDQDAEDMAELIEIGRLAVEHRRMSAVSAGMGKWYAKLTEMNLACDAHRAKQKENA